MTMTTAEALSCWLLIGLLWVVWTFHFRDVRREMAESEHPPVLWALAIVAGIATWPIGLASDLAHLWRCWRFRRLMKKIFRDP